MMKVLAIKMANHPLYPNLSPIFSVSLLLPYPSANSYQRTASKSLSNKKVKKRIPIWAQTRTIAVRDNSHTDMLINWLRIRTIDVYESFIDNTIFNEPSSPNF